MIYSVEYNNPLLLKYDCISKITELFTQYSRTLGPSPTMTTSVAASSVRNNVSTIYEGPFHLHSPALGTRVQQLWLLAEILTNNNDGNKSIPFLSVQLTNSYKESFLSVVKDAILYLNK